MSKAKEILAEYVVNYGPDMASDYHDAICRAYAELTGIHISHVETSPVTLTDEELKRASLGPPGTLAEITESRTAQAALDAEGVGLPWREGAPEHEGAYLVWAPGFDHPLQREWDGEEFLETQMDFAMSPQPTHWLPLSTIPLPGQGEQSHD